MLSPHQSSEHFTWQQEVRGAIRSQIELGHYFGNFEALSGFNFPVFIPARLALKIKLAGPGSPLWRQFIPSELEIDANTQKSGLLDPIGDHTHAKGSGIIHRYENRVLLAPTTVCPVQCRYCFRKNELHEGDVIFKQNLESALSYLAQDPQIEEVIFTGGDPLMLSDEKIQNYLSRLSDIEHIQYIRFHTRMPVIIPQRLSFELYQILKSFEKRFDIHLVIHTNHLDEFDEEINHQLKSFAIKKLSQSVLLRGVNDNEQDLAKLFRHLYSLEVRPYYLHHPDQVFGGMHFHLPLEHGQKLYQKLSKKIPGWMLPRYVQDPSNGSGKISAFAPKIH
jgi:lysine 2,3-aminomutase